MWIETDCKATSRLTQRLDNEFVTVEFSDNGTAQVADDVGETLIERYETISEYKSETESNNIESYTENLDE